jgi:hypothetical protein
VKPDRWSGRSPPVHILWSLGGASDACQANSIAAVEVTGEGEDTDGIKRRIGRLDTLSRGLAKEAVLMKAADDPLLSLERKADLTAIQDALLATGRVALARARQRLERGTETQP